MTQTSIVPFQARPSVGTGYGAGSDGLRDGPLKGMLGVEDGPVLDGGIDLNLRIYGGAFAGDGIEPFPATSAGVGWIF